MRISKLNVSKKEIGLKLRLIAALWFALAASVPVMFFLRLFGNFHDSGGFYSNFLLLWGFAGLPVSSAALSGFIFGADIFDPWKIDSSFQSTKRGLKVSSVSYLIFMTAFSAIAGLFSGESSIVSRLSVTVVVFFYLGFFGLLIVGWLIAIAGSLAGWMLFRLSRLSCFESTLFDSKRIAKDTLRKWILTSGIIFCAASVPATMKFYAVNQKRNVEVTNETTKSELIRAASDGNAEKLEALLTAGADVNVKNNAGESPLVLAAKSKNLRAVEVLLNHGADAMARGDVDMTPLLWAASNDNLPMVKALVARGADVNSARNDGYTPLMYAATAENTEMALLLLENGAYINARNKQNGTTALSAAMLKREHVKRWNREFANADPALSERQKSSGEDIIQLLISRGAVE